MTSRPSRRAVLLGGAAGAAAVAGAGFAGVETGVLPGRTTVDSWLGLSKVDPDVPRGPRGPVRYEQYESRARGKRVTWALTLPDDRPVRGLPVALVLHGRGGNAHSAENVLHADAYLADHVRRGGAPLALVSVDGDATYWHPRLSGDDSLAMILDEVLPRAGRLGADVSRIGLVGYSMGGFGALMLAREGEAGRLGGLRIAAAAASSPALFATAGSSAPGAFDDPADWRRWGDLAAHPQVSSTPLHVDCGVSDPFAQQTKRYRGNCPTTPAGGFTKGAHTGGYWRSVLPAQLDFLSGHLTA
ncbi:esterase [Angustibacter luteus]|uniref:Esterase n=1 Tax=Angustibacter luteus TaxID=658456 RepID=A0ABW1JGH5_9ACTN